MNWDLVIGVMSLLIATIAFYACIKIKELVEVQKTIALLMNKDRLADARPSE